MHDLNWDDLRLLLAIGQVGSLSGAADRLGINQSTVSRRLARLEAQLDCRLVERSVLGISLTEAGVELFQMAEQMSEDVTSRTARLIGRDANVSGRLIVTCVDMMVDRFLAPHLAAFADQYPDIELLLQTNLAPANLMKNEAEVAIRISADPHQVLVGTRICDFALSVYVAQAAIRISVTDREWIGWREEGTAARIMAQHFPDVFVRHRVDNYLAMNAMVRAGLGAAMLPCYWADQDGGLRRLYPETVPAGLGLWLLIHPDKKRMARIRAFVDFMVPRWKAHQNWFEGRGILDA